MIVGNGATNWEFDASPAFPATAQGFSVIPPKLYEDYVAANCTDYFREIWPMPNPEVCEPLNDQINDITQNLYIYDLLRPIPSSGGLKASDPERIGVAIVDGEEKYYKRGYTMAEYTPWLKKHPLANQEVVEEHILGDYVSDYVNDPKLRELINIPSDVPAWN